MCSHLHVSHEQTQVEDMITAAVEETKEMSPDAAPPPELRLPLVRLKVEHQGFNTISNQRFGSAFLGRVANPADLLLFWRRPAVVSREWSVAWLHSLSCRARG